MGAMPNCKTRQLSGAPSSVHEQEKIQAEEPLSVLLDLMTTSEMSFSWLLSLVMYFPDANGISETTVVTQRRVGSTLNEFILDVRVRFPADQLPAVPGSETCIICELLYGPNPRSCYPSSSKSSQALSSWHGVRAVPGPSSPLLAAVTAITRFRGRGGGWVCWEPIPARRRQRRVSPFTSQPCAARAGSVHTEFSSLFRAPIIAL